MVRLAFSPGRSPTTTGGAPSRVNILVVSLRFSHIARIASALRAIAADKPRVSPHETITGDIDGATVTIVYGRPYTKDPKTGAPRKIWGELVPFGKVWRTGADEATLLTTTQPLDIGGTSVPAGTYSLYTQPEANGSAKLII